MFCQDAVWRFDLLQGAREVHFSSRMILANESGKIAETIGGAQSDLEIRGMPAHRQCNPALANLKA